MANQIIIDIGAAANDGTGDPLRTAFNYVNNNFSNVWNTGLPTSNVQFLDNKILTINTNANLVLAPNGIAKVVSNVGILPNMSNVHGIGSSTQRWNSVYTQSIFADSYLYANGTPFSGGSGTYSNANVATFLAAYGSNTISTTGNITAGYVFGNGSQLTGIAANYSNANVAAFLPTYTGNLSANTISAGNVFVTTTVTAHDAYISTGTFPGDENTGDAALYIGSPTFTNLGSDIMAQFTGNVTTYAQINLQNWSNAVTASGDYILTADNGNDSTHYLDMGITSSTWDGSLNNVLSGLVPNNGYLYVQDGNLTLGTRAGNVSHTWNFDTTGNLTFPSGGALNMTGTSAGIVQSPNNDLIVTVQDDSNDDYALYNRVTDSGVTLGETRLRRGDFQVSFPNASKNFNFDDSGILGLPGDIALNTQGGDISLYAIDDGDSGSAELKTISFAGATLGSNVRVTQSAATISTSNAAHTWTFDNTGKLSAPGIIQTGVFNINTLPSAITAGAGARAFVTDADSTTFGTAYGGDSGNAMPVWSNGTSWFIG
jgi:hypothetical protein